MIMLTEYCSYSIEANVNACVNACVNLSSKTKETFTVKFDPRNGQNQCMYTVGSPQTITITGAGTKCAYLGKVEAKASSSDGDLCATDPSIYNIAYTTNLTIPKSETIQSR
jgi:hypothetical protein